MRILLTNDDGINAAGMAAMECVAAELSDDVWTVAPETDQSGIAHALTFSHPLRVRELGQRRFAVNGTPADCVIVGATRVLPERPDIVLSGINLGQNIADDVFYSGTIGGAMEACFMGIRGIALSQAYRMVDGERYAPWETSQAHLPDIVRRLLDAEWADGVFFNVNVPAVAADEVRGTLACHQGRVDHSLGTEERRDGRGIPYHWLRFARGKPREQPGSDLSALKKGYVAVSPLATDLTATERMAALAARFGREDGAP